MDWFGEFTLVVIALALCGLGYELKEIRKAILQLVELWRR